MTVQDEASYVCDSCGEEVVVPLDLSAGSVQEYVEDCPSATRTNRHGLSVSEDKVNEAEISRVTTAATAFRTALERCRAGLRHIVFKDFPHGACGDTCDLLGRFLCEQGLEVWTYVSARRGDRSHAWLERDGVIVDITADQFDDAESPVIVTKDSSWHRQFVAESRRPAGATKALPEVEGGLKRTYQAILEEMKAGD